MLLKNISDKKVCYILFALLWAYVIVRSFTVFYVHDELVSKWAYMISWNPLPYQGYVDANNQFLNSLLGGFFIRLFHSDAMWIVRLPNILAFPIFYFSLVGFKPFFKKKNAFYFFLISMSCTPFILDFFSLARGYGLAWAFFMWSLYQLFSYFTKGELKSLYLLLLGSMLTLYANLSLLPIVIVIYGFSLLYQFKLKLSLAKRISQLIAFLVAAIFFGFAIEYALNLQEIGKLYLGESEHFFKTTIEPLTDFIWSIDGVFAMVLVSLISLFILLQFVFKFYKKPALFSTQYIFPILLIAILVSIFLQNIILGVNFPSDRSIAHLVFLFYGSLTFALDQIGKRLILIALSGLVLLLFISKANFTHTLNYDYEHYDLELLTKIPMEVKGIPPSTAGKFYNQDNELNKVNKLPLRAVQAVIPEPVILEDYIIDFKKRDTVYKAYNIIHLDPISTLALYERKTFLNRKKQFSKTTQFDGKDEFVNLLDKQASQMGFIRCIGYFEHTSIQNQSTIIFTQENSETGEKYAYGGISPVTSAPIDESGKVSFDFTYTMMDFEDADLMAVYIYNPAKLPLKGEVSLSFYSIEL